MEALKFFSLFIGIWWTFVNVAKVFRGQAVPMLNLMIMSGAWTAFIYTIWR